MPRPFVYKKLDSILKYGDTCETVSLGHNVMWGIKNEEDWVTLCKEDTFGMEEKHLHRKYSRLFYASETTARTQANKLNKLFNTDKYRVAKVGEM
jgi:hypothetical protein